MGNDIDDPGYDAAADLNRDGTVSVADWRFPRKTMRELTTFPRVVLVFVIPAVLVGAVGVG